MVVVAGEHAEGGGGSCPRILGGRPRVDGWVWDGAVGYPGAEMQVWDRTRVVLPPCASELNPVERFFQELRRVLEGHLYAWLVVKQEVLAAVLQLLQANPARVCHLCGWARLRETLTASDGLARGHSSRTTWPIAHCISVGFPTDPWSPGNVLPCVCP